MLVTRYPNLTVVVERLLDIYCQLTGERHPEHSPASLCHGLTGSLQDPEVAQYTPDEKTTSLEGRDLSLR